MTVQGKKKLIWLFKTALVTAGVYIFLKYMLSIVMPFVIAYALCRLLEPAVLFLYRKFKVPIGISGTVLVTAVFSGLVLAAGILGRYLLEQLKIIIQNADSMILKLWEIIGSICDRISLFFGCSSERLFEGLKLMGENGMKLASENAYMILKNYGYPAVCGFLSIFVISAISAVAAALLIKNKRQIDGDIRQSEFFFEVSEIAARVCDTVGCFFKAQAIIIAIVALICGAGLKIAGTEYAALIGVGIAFLDALPVIGSGTILVPWLVIDFFIGNYRHGVILAVIYGLCTVVREVLEARLMGSRLGINEFYMMAVTFIGMKLFGISGIILGPVGLILILELLSQLKKRYRL